MNRFFDHAAASPPTRETLLRFVELAMEFPGNQESSGAMGETAKTALRDAESRLLVRICGRRAPDFRVQWHHAGTDAVQSAIRLLADSCPRGGTVLFTEGEHASALAALDELPERFQKRRVALLPDGRIDLDSLREACAAEPPAFAVFHWVQSETGAMQDVRALRGILQSVPLFLDAVQGIGKLDFPFESVRPDMLSISGQKIGAPSGAALVHHRRHAAAARAQRSERHAISRVPPAFCLLLTELLERPRPIPRFDLRATLLAELERVSPGELQPTLPESTSSPWILHLRARRCQGAHLVRSLARFGISIASGSACDAESDRPSRVLTAMGFRKDEAYRGVRISFSPSHEPEDLSALAEALARAIREY